MLISAHRRIADFFTASHSGSHTISVMQQGRGHYASAKVELRILLFDLTRQDISPQVVYRQEILTGLGNRVFQLVKDGTQLALTVWKAASLPHPQQLQMQAVEIKENPALGTEDDVRVATAMATVEALRHAARGIEEISQEVLNEMRANLAIDFTHEGKTKLTLHDQELPGQ
jgi:hypothetical protein